MALITCNECGNQVSGTAKACPQCGAKGKALVGPPPKKGMGKSGKIGLGVVGVVAMIAGIGAAMSPGSPPAADQKVADSATGDRDTNIVMYARSMKAAARNPDSLVYERVWANNDGSLACFKYRAQNGFGGTNRETVAFSHAGGSQDAKTIRTICHDKTMKDVTDTALPLIKLMG